MRRITLVGLLAAAFVLGGCGKSEKTDKAEKAGSDKPAVRKPVPGVTIDPAAERAAVKFVRGGAEEPTPVAQPGEEETEDPNDPDAPKFTPMQKKFHRLRDLLTMSQIVSVMGKPAETGEVYANGPTWAAWNEGSRRFLVQMLNQRLALWCSYDPKDTNGLYDRFQQVKVGMPKDQVRKLLGVSGKFMGSGSATVNGGTNVYDHGENGYMIFFVDDKVAKIIK